MDRDEQVKKEIEQQELERLESNAGVYDDDFVDEYAYIDQEEAKEQINNKHLNYLKSVLIAQLLLEANDELKGSKAFKQNVKYQVGKTNKLLEEVYQEGFNVVYYNNPEFCTNVLNKIDSLIHKIKTATIDELVMIDALIDKYYENSEEIKENQEIEFTNLK